jgi:hypothetical protein
MEMPAFLTRILAWLHAGYPEGVPDTDTIPLFALLGTQLSDDEMKAIAAELEKESTPESAEAMKRAITSVTDHHPTEGDIARVRARLAAGGWPLAVPDRSAD